MQVTEATVRSILTRTSGFLRTVTSHSLQPYRGCSFGGALCGVGCYVQHNRWITRGERWGAFLEARTNAAERYAEQAPVEVAWARRARGRFGIFLSSSTDPFLPLEEIRGLTRSVLEAMLAQPPDLLIVQTHSDRVTRAAGLLVELSRRCELRVHVSIESDRDTLPGLPGPACSVERRLLAVAALSTAGLRTVVTVSPLLPITRPQEFFERIAASADAVVIDHFIEGDGTPDGSRTVRTSLPAAMAAVDPASTALGYRDEMIAVARAVMPGRVGVSIDGFAGRYT